MAHAEVEILEGVVWGLYRFRVVEVRSLGVKGLGLLYSSCIW